jgi:APA family basic amino acid/polyamine antiporter
MALTFAAYVAPGPWQRPAAVAAVVALAAVNCRGVTRTAGLARILVALVLVVLAVVSAAGWVAGQPDLGRLDLSSAQGGVYGVLQSAGLLFFAFAGYARIATLGEEVRDPERIIPRAIVLALAVAVAAYTAVAVTLLAVLGADRVAASTAPLADLARSSGWGWMAPVVAVGGAAASLGALLALIAGIGRTTLAMAREADLPRRLAAVHPRHQVPQRAEIVVAAVVVVLVLTVDLRGAIGFSSFGVLLYYLTANVAAYSQTARHRRFPRALQILGAAGCLLLLATLPGQAVVGGVLVVAIGVAYRTLRTWWARR